MPIVDLQIVCAPNTEPVSAQLLADTLGQVFGSAPGRTWVRVYALSSAAYAENETSIAESELPTFVSILHAHPPVGVARANEVLAITNAVAACIGRQAACVHVQYAPAGAGRQAFGGRLVE